MPYEKEIQILSELRSEYNCFDSNEREYYHALSEAIRSLKTVDAEPTEEQVKEYCRKRCLVIVTSELFNETKARWSAEPVRHGHWETYLTEGLRWKCSECGSRFETPYHYCPNCGAKMDEVEDE